MKKKLAPKKIPISELVKMETKIDKLSSEKRSLIKKYKYSVSELKKKELEMSAFFELTKSNRVFTIKPSKNKTGEAVAVIVASDWHIDETVKPASISNRNSFNPKVAKKRAMLFFRNAVKLIKITKKDVSVDTVILALLGDFISSEIHDELKENNSMLPMEGILFVQELLKSGIRYLLKHTDCNFIVPCCVGNHTRITPRVNVSTEYGNSLEFLMYNSLKLSFENQKRITFIISEGYHCYVKVLGKTLRFHHGHACRFYGGIGGIYIPVNKAIAQWNKMKHADIDVFGHFHQFKDGGDFICNGSLIGYNAYALRIKADYDKPKQAFFLIDKKRGKTIVAPIFLEKV